MKPQLKSMGDPAANNGSISWQSGHDFVREGMDRLITDRVRLMSGLGSEREPRSKIQPISMIARVILARGARA